MKKRWLLLIFILFIPLVFAGGYMEYLTRGLADTLYCAIGGNCAVANLNITGTLTFNGTVNGTNGIDGINGTSINVTSIILLSNGSLNITWSNGDSFITGNVTGANGIDGVNGSGSGNTTDIWVNETGDTMTGDLIMTIDQKYAWTDDTYMILNSTTNEFIFQLG